jgi:hypothetical protein
MSEDERHFLMSLSQPQARFTVEQTAWALNFKPYEILGLVSLEILAPIGNPAANATKYFFAQEILQLAKDKNFLKRATNAMYQSRLKKNKSQRARREAGVNPGAVISFGAADNGHSKPAGFPIKTS